MIGEIEGRTVAFLHLRVEGQLHHAAKIAEILEFDVERSHRGRNLGQQFLLMRRSWPGTMVVFSLN